MTAAQLDTLDLPALIDHALRRAIVALTSLIEDPDAKPETKRKAITDLLRFAARGLFAKPATPQPKTAPTQPPPAPEPPATDPAPTDSRTPSLLLNTLQRTASEERPPVKGAHKRPRTRFKQRAKR